MLNDANLPSGMRKGLWTEAANTAVHISNIVKTKYQDVTPYEAFYKKKPRHVNYLKQFGEMGVVTYRKGTETKRTKIDNKARPCMFVGYADNRPIETYRFYDTETRQFIISREVRWLSKFYGEWKGLIKKPEREVITEKRNEETSEKRNEETSEKRNEE